MKKRPLSRPLKERERTSKQKPKRTGRTTSDNASPGTGLDKLKHALQTIRRQEKYRDGKARSQGMDISKIVDNIDQFHTAWKLLVAFLAALTTIRLWIRLRIGVQRRYFHQLRRLSKLPKYWDARETALNALDGPARIQIQEIEKRLVQLLAVDLTPSALGLRAYLEWKDAAFLISACRNLSCDVFVDFANDLIERVILILDDLVDMQNHRQVARWITSHEEANAQREVLRQHLADDRQELERHIALMQQYLAGQLVVEVCPEQVAAFKRQMLTEKYKAYSELSSDDLRGASRHVELA